LISDGTINITELIVALYFEKNGLTIIEEPGRNIHPYLISKVIDMMKEVSQNKQIIITTHNPEIIKYAGLNNILILSRDENGFSTVTRPNKKTLKIFLKNEIGIEELYIQNLLRV
jgi:predicted ATPase